MEVVQPQVGPEAKGADGWRWREEQEAGAAVGEAQGRKE